jgi:uncharacterized membrane protein YvlD (DUF360 family)
VKRLLVKWLVVTLLIAVSPRLTSEIHVGGLGAALWAALVYGLLVVLIGWLIRAVVTVLSIVPGVLTFGLFFVLVPIITNAALLKLTAGLLGSFSIRTWGAAFVLSLALTVVDLLLDPEKRPRRRARRS